MRNYSADQLRMFFLSHHYRTDMDLRGLDSAARAYNRLRGMAKKCNSAAGVSSKDCDEDLLQRFCDTMNDDFDTPQAIQAIGEGLRSTTEERGAEKAARTLASIRTSCNILGIDLGIG